MHARMISTPRWLTWSAVLALAAFLVAAAPASAQVDAAKLVVAKGAAASLIERAKGSEKTGEMPRETDPAVKRLLETIYDSSDVQAARSIPASALGALSERMLAGAQVGTVYMLAGTGATELAQMAGRADADEKVNLNVIKFAPEMGRFFDFQLRMEAAILDGVDTRIATARRDDIASQKFQSSLADIRGGATKTVAGVIETLAVNGLSDDWRRDRLPALTAIAPRLAKFLETGQKADLQKLAEACADVMDDPTVKQGLQAFAKTLAGG